MISLPSILLAGLGVAWGVAFVTVVFMVSAS
jgi:hypothetical protein